VNHRNDVLLTAKEKPCFTSNSTIGIVDLVKIFVWGGGAVAASLAAELSGLGNKTFLNEKGKVLGLGGCGNPFNDFIRRGRGNILP